MSPSESDLRAALQHGDDDGLGINANAIIAHGQAIRARRVRILSGAAAAVVVAAGAVGLAFARGDGGGGSSNLAGGGAKSANLNDSVAGGASQKDAQHAPAATVPSAAASPSATSVPGPAAAQGRATTSCPESAPHLLLPGGGGSGQFGADDALFSKPVDTLVVCVYGTAPGASSGAPARLTFTGQQATAIIASMENAGRTPNQTPCDPGASSTSQLLAFIGVTPAGNALDPVTATVTDPACDVQLTNGTAVRYSWSPPAILIGELRGLTPPKVPPRTIADEPTGIVHGTPIHS
jgi:hypothetical protein